MTDEPIDQLAVLRAELDQLVAMMPEIARAARAYFAAFRKEGFDDKQALYLTAVEVVQNPGVPPA